ncbi:MAG: hypothetical protein HUJ51_01440 [Eggerthellaceae bacterium]|nr:hypothetical protein [Eggerthellaceae bacterium]
MSERRKIVNQFNMLNIKPYYANGFDHPYVVEGKKDSVKFLCKEFRIQLMVNVAQTCIEVHSGIFSFKVVICMSAPCASAMAFASNSSSSPMISTDGKSMQYSSRLRELPFKVDLSL